MQHNSKSVSLDPEQHSFVQVFDNGSVTIVGRDQETVHLSAQGALNLLEALYQQRDVIFHHAATGDGTEEQEQPDTELQAMQKYGITEILYAVGTDHSAFSARYLLPNDVTPKWFGHHAFSSSHEASLAFLAQYPDARIISPEQLEKEFQKRYDTFVSKKNASLDQDGDEPNKWHLGTGLLSWPSEERITGRYGLVALFDEHWNPLTWQIDISLPGTQFAWKYGALVAVLDGEEIELGRGKVFSENHYTIDYIGLRPPLDYLEDEWLSPSQLHKVDGHIIRKPVELWFVEL